MERFKRDYEARMKVDMEVNYIYLNFRSMII